MHQRHSHRALERAQWFKDLTTALAEAEKLLACLESDGGFPVEMVRLRIRVQSLRSELELLNRVTQGEGRVVGNCWPQPAAAGALDS